MRQKLKAASLPFIVNYWTCDQEKRSREPKEMESLTQGEFQMIVRTHVFSYVVTIVQISLFDEGQFM